MTALTIHYLAKAIEAAIVTGLTVGALLVCWIGMGESR